MVTEKEIHLLIPLELYHYGEWCVWNKEIARIWLRYYNVELEGSLEESVELNLIIQVITLHFGIEYIPSNAKLEDRTLKIVDMAAKIDALDNGCVGALTYIENEILSNFV